MSLNPRLGSRYNIEEARSKFERAFLLLNEIVVQISHSEDRGTWPIYLVALERNVTAIANRVIIKLAETDE